MQLKTIFSALAAVLASTAAVAAASVAGTNAVDTNNEDLNDATSKIIVVPGGGYPHPRSPIYPGGRDPTIIIIQPYGPYGPYGSTLARRPGKRADEDNMAAKILPIPNPDYLTSSAIGRIRPFPKSVEDVDEDSKILLINPGAGPLSRYPPIVYPGYPIDGRKPPYLKRADIDAVADADAVEDENENEDVNYSKIFPPSPYWDPRRPHIMS
ncbi:hypothetical protein BGZ97_012109 [Linnemannia gamsii]|jgi:hypothetical protein|uniref:Uncharacterized protein n=1 Tax=Linnemannia gamsii TaxID=64522 RepID=A0A9P6RIM9_9FUNG|nr:hypothetical protein BGZ97_012109 [Linnemannia gamsii]